MAVCLSMENIRIARALLFLSMVSVVRTTSGKRLTSLPFVPPPAFMLAAINILSAPSEHSGLVQNCDDDGCHLALIKSDVECCYSIISSSFLLQSADIGTVELLWQARSMNTVVLNTRELVFILSLPAFSDMNKHTYSACIKIEIPCIVMFLHLATSTSIRAVDDLQSN